MRRPIACGLLSLLVCASLPTLSAAQDAPPTTQPIDILGKATRVSLSLKDVSPYDAFKALESASGIKVSLPPKEMFERQAERKVTVELTDATWMEAAVKIADMANVRLNYISGRWNLSFGGNRRATPRRYFTGPLLATANRVIVEREMRYGDPPSTSRTVTLAGSLLAEPQILAMDIDRPCEFVSAIDDQGRPLRALPTAQPQGSAVRPKPTLYSPNERRDFSLSMVLPEDDARSIKHLKAIVHATIPSKTELLQFSDILNSEGATASVGDAKFTVERVDPMGQNYAVVLRVETGSLPPNFFYAIRTNQPPFQPRLGPNSAPGAVNVHVTNSVMQDGVATVTLTVIINPARQRNNANAADESEPTTPPVVHLHWTLPQTYQQIAVPIEFTDIPLPQ